MRPTGAEEGSGLQLPRGQLLDASPINLDLLLPALRTGGTGSNAQASYGRHLAGSGHIIRWAEFAV